MNEHVYKYLQYLHQQRNQVGDLGTTKKEKSDRSEVCSLASMLLNCHSFKCFVGLNANANS